MNMQDKICISPGFQQDHSQSKKCDFILNLNPKMSPNSEHIRILHQNPGSLMLPVGPLKLLYIIRFNLGIANLHF